jgi:hypothetical protein
MASLFPAFTSGFNVRNFLVGRGADKFLVFLFAAKPKEFFLDGLKKLEQRSHKCMELRGNM